MIYFTSDTHFWHKNVIKFCDRPFNSVEEMNHTMIDNWNSTITPEDTVYFLGDFAFCSQDSASRIVKRLNGQKIIVVGNHDKKVEKWWDGKIIAGNTSIHIGPTNVLLSHYPYPPSKEALELNPYDVRFLERRYEDRGQFLIHGHIHQHWLKRDKQINVGVDVTDFKPLSIDTVEKIMKDERTFIKNIKEFENGTT